MAEEDPFISAELIRRRQKLRRVEKDQSLYISPSVYEEFIEFSISEVKSLRKAFEKYDLDKNGFIDFVELKLMMEKLGNPQTHLALKQMIMNIDKDKDGMISFKEFVSIFKLARDGVPLMEGLQKIADTCDVSAVGVMGAKTFFEAKAEDAKKGRRPKVDISLRERELREEQQRAKEEEAEQKRRKRAFRERIDKFQKQF